MALGALTTITASSPVVADVSLSSPATITVDDGQAISHDVVISGKGRVVGIVLTRPPVSDRGPQLLMALRAGGCWTEGCSPDHVSGWIHYVTTVGLKAAPGPSPRTYTLPAGAYQLHVITDGTPVRATLRLGGVAGSVTLAPTKPSRLVIDSPSPTLVAPATENIYSAGASSPITSANGLLFHVDAFAFGPYIDGVLGDCLYVDHGPPNGTYLPGCPNSDGGDTGVLPGPFVQGGRAFVYGANVTLRPGAWSQGFYFDSVALNPDIHTVKLWLDFTS